MREPQCATKTRNITNWFNPCAFGNPLPASDIPNTQTAANPVGQPLTTVSAVLPIWAQHATRFTGLATSAST